MRRRLARAPKRKARTNPAASVVSNGVWCIRTPGNTGNASSAAWPADDDVRNGSRTRARDGKAERLSANGAGQSDRPMAFERPDGGYGSWRNPARYRQVNPLTFLEF
ncbi:hypothetical protein CRPA25_63730 [Pseudomonas aeruginosa]